MSNYITLDVLVL